MVSRGFSRFRWITGRTLRKGFVRGLQPLGGYQRTFDETHRFNFHRCMSISIRIVLHGRRETRRGGITCFSLHLFDRILSNSSTLISTLTNRYCVGWTERETRLKNCDISPCNQFHFSHWKMLFCIRSQQRFLWIWLSNRGSVYLG
jgi:hypothetical protein